MFICEDCHTKHQDDLEVESQEIQWTGETTLKKGLCPECDSHWLTGTFYEYLNAFELCREIDELKTKLAARDDIRPAFPLSQYAEDARDLRERINHFPSILDDPEAVRQVIRYAAELEEVLDNADI
jgi:hypothetical protein